MNIEIAVGDIVLAAELNDSATARQVASLLPIAAEGSVWGDEIYFAIDLHAQEADDAVEEVPVGTLAYWPPGHAFCIFYGPTPVSRDETPRAYSPVNVIGQITDDATRLRGLRGSVSVRVGASEEGL